MSYSFTKSLFQKWTVQSEPQQIPDTEFKYHKVFLPNAAMESLVSHAGQHSDVSGLVQQWSVEVFDEAEILKGEMQETPQGPVMVPPFMFVVESEKPLTPFPVVERLVADSVGVLRAGRYEGLDFPTVTGCKIFSMPPVSPGIAFNTGKLSTGGFYLVFKCAHPEPLELTVSMRAQIFVHNN